MFDHFFFLFCKIILLVTSWMQKIYNISTSVMMLWVLTDILVIKFTLIFTSIYISCFIGWCYENLSLVSKKWAIFIHFLSSIFFKILTELFSFWIFSTPCSIPKAFFQEHLYCGTNSMNIFHPAITKTRVYKYLPCLSLNFCFVILFR